MTATELTELAALLAPAQAALAAQRRFEQRGRARRRAAGAGSTGLLTDADRLLVTVVYQRQLCSMNVLSDLLGVNANSIGQAIAETRQLLAEHGRTIPASTLRFAAAYALTEFASGSRPEPARPRLAERLATPALTGMTRARPRRPDRPGRARAGRPRRATSTSTSRRRTTARRPRRHLHAEDH
jgi:hypothetical protein